MAPTTQAMKKNILTWIRACDLGQTTFMPHSSINFIHLIKFNKTCILHDNKCAKTFFVGWLHVSLHHRFLYFRCIPKLWVREIFMVNDFIFILLRKIFSLFHFGNGRWKYIIHRRGGVGACIFACNQFWGCWTWLKFYGYGGEMHNDHDAMTLDF